jgi:glycosyltransferase involved in cell wall biosynthesis
MTQRPARVAIAIPAFQAAPYVADVAQRALVMASQLEGFDLVLAIDDGSTDATAAVARSAGCEVVRHSKNRGKGAALRTAFDTLFSRGYDAVVTVDADGQHLPEEIPKLISVWGPEVDLVLGTRDHLFEGMSPLRRWSNRMSSRAISCVAGTSLPDVQTGFRLYTRQLIARLPMVGERFAAESAIVVRATRCGLRIACAPVELGFADGRHTSHYRPWIDSLRIARAVLRARAETPQRLQELSE